MSSKCPTAATFPISHLFSFSLYSFSVSVVQVNKYLSSYYLLDTIVPAVALISQELVAPILLEFMIFLGRK